jgi:Fur family transcriptional regulator, ferric uptake regulator
MTFKRTTAISEKVLSIFNTQTHPITYNHLLSSLTSAGLQFNKSTLYRIINKLLRTKTIHTLTLQNGITYYEKKQDNHHSHFLCTNCQDITCIDLLNHHQDINKSLSKTTNFHIHNQEYNLYGHCEICVEKAS